MVIYADELFLINFVSAYIMLYILARSVFRMKIKKKRILLASLLAGLAAVLIFCTDMPLYLTYAVQLISVFIVVTAAFYRRDGGILSQIGAFFLLSGGMMLMMIFSASLIGKAVPIVLKGGILYMDISPGIFAVSFILSYAAMIFIIKLLKKRKNKKYYMMTVKHGDKTIRVKALFDSGNMLKDPVSGKCVTILEWDEAKKLFDAKAQYSDLSEHIGEMKLRIIPFRSLGNPSGIIFAFYPDSVSVEGRDGGDCFIGIYGGRLSKNNEYHALIGAGLI